MSNTLPCVVGIQGILVTWCLTLEVKLILVEVKTLEAGDTLLFITDQSYGLTTHHFIT